MTEDFEKELDTIITRWPEVIGYSKWEEVAKVNYTINDQLHLIKRLKDDQLIVQHGFAGFELTAKGYAIKRNIQTIGYMAQRVKTEQKEKRENELFDLTKQNLKWTKRTTLILLATLIVTILSTAYIIYNK